MKIGISLSINVCLVKQKSNKSMNQRMHQMKELIKSNLFFLYRSLCKIVLLQLLPERLNSYLVMQKNQKK